MTPAELTEAREALGLRSIDFARTFQISDRTLRAWEAGAPRWRIPFATATLIKLAVKFPQVRRALGIAKKAADKGQSATP
jgi:DNA-binding transcriptional regulator YiaG